MTAPALGRSLAALQAVLEEGLRHHEAGRLPEAEALYRQVLAQVPDHPDALQLLADLAQRAGEHAQAVELLRHATRINPSPHGFNQLGLALHAAGRRDEAIAALRRALALNPGYSEAHNHLGLALQEAGRLDAALACFHAALDCRPGNAQAINNLGIALDALGRKPEALAAYRRALALEDIAAFRANFAQCVRSSTMLPNDADFRALVTRAIAEPWARPADLAPAAIGLVMAQPSNAALLEARDAALDAAGLATLAGDGLLRAVLESFPVCEIALERLLTRARRALLDDAQGAAGATPDDATLAFPCALARQCFLNDYVFAPAEAEIAQARALRATLAAAIASGAAVSATTLAAVGSYFPLGEVAGIDALLERPWPAPVAALLAQQVAEPRAEARLRAGMARLTRIEDSASRAVRAQYEANPYPKWAKLPPAEAPSPVVRAALSGAIPDRALRAGALDILVAGCGTGQESIELARLHRAARVLAIDLSLASLGYAARRAGELGVANLEHAQADILALEAALGDGAPPDAARRFDVISSVGVLHHLADPLAGWRILLSLLRPGGSMLVGLYSERGRADVAAARAFVSEQGFPPTPDGIRGARQALAAAPAHAAIALRRDFFTVSECRDLLFHVEEHCFTLPGVARMIAQLGVAFTGFVVEPQVLGAYRERFPADAAMTDLTNWDAFESAFPATFSGMYVFGVRKHA